MHSRTQAIAELARRGISVETLAARADVATAAMAARAGATRSRALLAARAAPTRSRRSTRSWHRTTASMAARRGDPVRACCGTARTRRADGASGSRAILANQAWRGAARARLPARRARRRATRRAGARYWSVGSTIAGALWGVAAVAMFPASPPHQALLIVCLFGVVLGGLNLTAVYKPSFYGFVLPALVPLIVRVALEGDQVHLFTALRAGRRARLRARVRPPASTTC